MVNYQHGIRFLGQGRNFIYKLRVKSNHIFLNVKRFRIMHLVSAFLFAYMVLGLCIPSRSSHAEPALNECILNPKSFFRSRPLIRFFWPGLLFWLVGCFIIVFDISYLIFHQKVSRCHSPVYYHYPLSLQYLKR